MDPNVVELAQKIAAFLLPFLPHLLKVGDKAAEEVGKKIGGEGWERAKALWERMRRGMSSASIYQPTISQWTTPSVMPADRSHLTILDFGQKSPCPGD